MPNARILATNIADSAGISASPALVTTLPETNLQTLPRKRTARSTSTASQDIKLSWSSAQRVNMVALRYHNLTAAAQMRVRTYTDAAWTTGLVDNAAANCFGYSGFSNYDVLTDADFRLLKNSARYFTLATNVQSMIITITDAANPDGYFDISRLFVGEYFEFAYQLMFGGAPISTQDFSIQARADSGTLITEKREKARKFDLSQSLLNPQDWPEILSIARRCGLDKDLWLSIFPGDGTYLEAWYQAAVKFEAMPAFDRHFPGLAQMKLTLAEN